MSTNVISNKTWLLFRHSDTEPGVMVSEAVVLWLSIFVSCDCFVAVCFSSSPEMEASLVLNLQDSFLGGITCLLVFPHTEIRACSNEANWKLSIFTEYYLGG